LVVDDVADTREIVRKLLQVEADIEVVGATLSGDEGMLLAQDLDPDVVRTDINMPGIDGKAATEAIRQNSPHVQVVILSVQGDQNYIRRAMVVGDRDFLTMPPSGDELAPAVRRGGEMSQLERSKDKRARAVVLPLGNV